MKKLLIGVMVAALFIPDAQAGGEKNKNRKNSVTQNIDVDNQNNQGNLSIYGDKANEVQNRISIARQFWQKQQSSPNTQGRTYAQVAAQGIPPSTAPVEHRPLPSTNQPVMPQQMTNNQYGYNNQQFSRPQSQGNDLAGWNINQNNLVNAPAVLAQKDRDIVNKIGKSLSNQLNAISPYLSKTQKQTKGYFNNLKNHMSYFVNYMTASAKAGSFDAAKQNNANTVNNTVNNIVTDIQQLNIRNLPQNVQILFQNFYRDDIGGAIRDLTKLLKSYNHGKLQSVLQGFQIIEETLQNATKNNNADEGLPFNKVAEAKDFWEKKIAQNQNSSTNIRPEMDHYNPDSEQYINAWTNYGNSQRNHRNENVDESLPFNSVAEARKFWEKKIAQNQNRPTEQSLENTGKKRVISPKIAGLIKQIKQDSTTQQNDWREKPDPQLYNGYSDNYQVLNKNSGPIDPYEVD